MIWRDLPQEMQELILAKLSLVELGRASRTCRNFQDFFRSQLEFGCIQETRCHLAESMFGQKWMKYLSSLIAEYIKEKTVPTGLGSDFGEFCSISADGKFHVYGALFGLTASQSQCFWQDAGNMAIFILLHGTLEITVGAPAPNRSQVRLDIWPKEGGLPGAIIRVAPRGDDDLWGLALVQALLGGPLSPSSHNGELGLTVEVKGSRKHRGTWAGLQAQVRPLLPFATVYTYNEGLVGHQEWYSIGNTHVYRRRPTPKPTPSVVLHVGYVVG
jgi:hypothetical protein